MCRAAEDITCYDSQSWVQYQVQQGGHHGVTEGDVQGHLVSNGDLGLVPAPAPVPESYYEEWSPKDEVGARDETHHLQPCNLLLFNPTSEDFAIYRRLTLLQRMV